MFASDIRPCINDRFVVAGKYRMLVHRVWRRLRKLQTWRDVGDNNNNNNNFILTPDSEVKLRSVVFTITITYSKTSRVKNCQYIHKLPILL